MSTKPAELGALISGDELGRKVAHLWDRWNMQRHSWQEEWKELRNFIFATDSTYTSQGENTPWKNKTTLPKLTQIRDNLHSNYLSALFPNQDWMKWEAAESGEIPKANAIESYMQNKLRDGTFRNTMSKLLYDYIDSGNAFTTVSFTAQYLDGDSKKIPGFVGPELVRIDPHNIVFNPVADSFKDSPKIIRRIVNVGEIKAMVEDQPDNEGLRAAYERSAAIRTNAGSYSYEDNVWQEGLQIDGFGNLHEYYMSEYCELLEFWGDWHDKETGELHRNRRIVVIDRREAILDEKNPSWFGSAPIFHVGWRFRPNNLWAMGPLANLVGLQYRIDHLENSKADAYDLAIHPPLKIIGEVDDFDWGPGCEVHLDEGGDVQEIIRTAQWVIQAQNEIASLEFKMEQFAGAPREAMGIRTPGEKTAYEVQELQNAAGRIFQEKITTFETELLEPALNAMLETARRNMDTSDIVRVMDDDLGVESFMTITAEDITAKGKLRPRGARHFAAQAQLLQNLTGVMNSPLAGMLQPHTSSIRMAALVEEILGLEKYELFKPNVAVQEQQETQRQVSQAEEDLAAEAGVPVP